jgi:putative transcriptional regulator
VSRTATPALADSSPSSAPGEPRPARDDEETAHRIRCHLDDLLRQRGMTLTELAARAGITVANLAVLKNGRARAVRFSTLTALCDALQCTPADLLSIEEPSHTHQPSARPSPVR